MYKYVKCEEQTEASDILEYCLVVSIDYVDSSDVDRHIAASIDRSPLTPQRAKFESFVINTLGVMSHLKYTIIEDYTHDSSNDGSESVYYAFKQDREILGKPVRFVVFLRITQHGWSEAAEALQRRDQYYDAEFQKYKMEYGARMYYNVVVDAEDPNSKISELRSLKREVKAFTVDSIADANADIRSELEADKT